MARPPLVPPGPELTAQERTRYARHLLLPGPRHRRAASAARRPGARRRGGRPGLAGPALPRGCRGRHDRGRRRRRRRDDEPPAPGRARRRRRRPAEDDVRGRGGARDQPGDRRSSSTASGSTPATPSTSSPTTTSSLDGADNFPTRYLVGDACARLGVPHVWGSVFRFDGQVSVWWAGEGPCYACVFPHQPPPDAVPSCAVGGVLGAVCASIGSVMATEAVKLVTGTGEPLVGRLLVHDALRQTWDALPVAADPGCRVCGSGADPTRAARVGTTPRSGRMPSPAEARAAATAAVRARHPAGRPSTSRTCGTLLDAGGLDGSRGAAPRRARGGRARGRHDPRRPSGCRWATCGPAPRCPAAAGGPGLRPLQDRGRARRRRSTSCAPEGSTRSTSRAASSRGSRDVDPDLPTY